MTLRLSGHQRKQLAAQIKSDIDEYCRVVYDDGYRDHLGASIIGTHCSRALTYSFRHMYRERFSGRMQRLFNRGQLEENRFIEWLSGILATVWADGETGESGKQARITGVENHYGGSLDGRIKLPDRYGIGDEPFILEMKTHNDNSFKKLVKNGVKLSKPMHYDQMCAYGEAYGMPYGLYMAINKNDDDIHPEIVELDHELGKKFREEKAPSIIYAKQLPPKIAATSAYEGCKWCGMVPVCHENAPVDINCRSCANSAPGPNATWICHHWQSIIPKEAIPLACPQWREFGKC